MVVCASRDKEQYPAAAAWRYVPLAADRSTVDQVLTVILSIEWETEPRPSRVRAATAMCQRVRLMDNSTESLLFRYAG
jgi:hypothetical protein